MSSNVVLLRKGDWVGHIAKLISILIRFLGPQHTLLPVAVRVRSYMGGTDVQGIPPSVPGEIPALSRRTTNILFAFRNNARKSASVRSPLCVGADHWQRFHSDQEPSAGNTIA